MFTPLAELTLPPSIPGVLLPCPIGQPGKGMGRAALCSLSVNPQAWRLLCAVCTSHDMPHCKLPERGSCDHSFFLLIRRDVPTLVNVHTYTLEIPGSNGIP